MAGESPDKSDKKQSSGETARSKRDPRLSAFRGEPAEPAKESGAGTDSKPEKKPEAAAAPKPAAKSGSAAKPGSGTKSRSGVKSGSAAESKSSAEPESAVEPESAAELESAAESESAGSSVASAGADAPEASEASEGAAEGADGGKGGTGGKGGGNDRLRAAVAAWVAGADDGDAEGTDAEGTQDAEDGDGGDADEASAGSGDLGEGVDGDGDGGTGEGADGAVAKPSVEPEAAAEPKADEEADGKGKAAAKGAGVAESAPKTESGAESKAEAESKTATKVVDQPTAVFKTVGPQKGKPDEKGGAAADGKAEAEAKGKGKSDGKGDGGDEGDADVDESAVDEATRVFAVAKLKGKGAAAGAVDQATTAFKINAPAKSKDAAKDKDAAESKGATEDKAAAKDKAAGESGSKAEAKPGSAAAGKGKGKSGTKDGADAKTDSKADAKSDAKAEAKSDAKSDAKAGEKADSKADAKAGSKADSKAPGTSERDSERTSQFVALKSADDGTAGKSLGKTAPRTPARTSDKAGDKAGDNAAEKPAEKSGSQAAAKTADKAADKPAGKPEGKPEDKAAGALPAAKPAKPAKGAEAAAPSKAADRPGAMPSAATGATAAGAPGALPESERTKQEPLPPLDLLAQLTNTPPPPETPLRTVVRRFKIWTPLAVLLVIVFIVAQAVRPLPNPTLTVGDAKSSFIFEGGKLAVPWPEHGQAAVKVVGSGDLGTFGPQKPVPTASVAKIMTAYVILRDHPLKKDDKGPDIEVDAKAVTEGGSRHESRIEGLKAGQKFNQQDMLKMLMIPSGNNIARLLARWDTKSADEGAFVKKMNSAAKELGMKNTTYTDPSGLDPKTVSTAVDQLKLAEAVMKFDAFRPIVAMPNAEIRGLPGRINNNNDDLLLAGLSIKGIKTGSSTAAGGTLSWAAYKTVDGKDRLILGTMMDQHFKGLDPDASNSLTMVKNNSKKVVEVVRDALTSAPAVKKGQVVGYVDDGLNGRTPVVATKDLKAVGVPGQKLKLSVGDGGKTIPHTAKAGTEVGVLTVGNGESTQQVPVALQKDLVEPAFGAKLIRIT
ncbi:D-alanyl-D-alanine carboxypeptidase [Streptomyces angustmyceticus]|uniref:D-alanyl-D-alanine carboxypeptidase n=1 Tax=Streptomyces angustmyceticus TaxID=285578 RepID=UPI003682FCBC